MENTESKKKPEYTQDCAEAAFNATSAYDDILHSVNETQYNQHDRPTPEAMATLAQMTQDEFNSGSTLVVLERIATALELIVSKMK